MSLYRCLRLVLRFFGDPRISVLPIEQSDTLSSAGTVTGFPILFVSLAGTNADDTVASNTAVLANVSFSYTEPAETFSAAGGTGLTANASITHLNDTLSSLSSVSNAQAGIFGSLSSTDSIDSVSSAVDVLIEGNGSFSTTEAGPAVYINEGPLGSWYDNSSPYSMSLSVTPESDSRLVMVAVQSFPNGYHSNTGISDTGSLTWTKHYERNTTGGANSDVLRTTIWSAPISTSPGTISISITSNNVIGPSVWKFMHVHNADETTPILRIVNAVSSSANSSGPALSFNSNSNPNSALLAIASIMGSSDNTVDADMPTGWTVIREYERINVLPDMDASTYALMAVSNGGAQTVTFDNISGTGLRTQQAAIVEFQPASVQAAADTLSATANVVASAVAGVVTMDVDFQNRSTGSEYTSSYIAGDFNWPEAHPGEVVGSWTTGLNQQRVYIREENGNKFMRVRYPSGSSGHIQWRGDIRDGTATNEDVTVKYKIRYNNVDLAASGGGKNHGVGGGHTPTGGQSVNGGAGFTVRVTWQAYGGFGYRNPPCFCFYVYDMDKPDGSYGREIAWESPFPGTTQNSHYNSVSNPIQIAQNVWHDIEYRIVMNDVGSANGKLYGWLNGELVCKIDNMRYRSSSSVGADSFIFNGYFGGPGVTSKEEYIDYDDFKVIVNNGAAGPVTGPTPGAQIIGSSEIQNTFTYRTSHPEADFRTALDEGRLAWAPDPENSNITCLRMEVEGGTRGILQWLTDLGGTWDDVTLEFDIRFVDANSGEFDFQVVGKFPGLAGGTAPNSGRPITSDGRGFSCRHQWVVFSTAQTKHFTTYMYDLDSGGSTASGENIYFETNGQPVKSRHDLSSSGASPSLTDDRWYRVTQRVTMNTPGSANGRLREWVDGQLALQLDNCRFRLDSNHGIDCIFWQIMFGGSDNSTYRASKDSYLYFKNVKFIVHDTGTTTNINFPSLS